MPSNVTGDFSASVESISPFLVYKRQGESRIVSPHHRKWNGPLVLFWLHLASTIPPNAAPEAGLRARVAPATVNTRFNSGVLT